jgi:hypothetical protein
MLARLRSKNLHTWLGGYARHLARDARRPAVSGPRHLLFAICDHFEPRWKNPTAEVAEERVRMWEEGYPRTVGEFRDADGMPPRHSFFFPAEEYAPSYLDALARMTKARLGEVEIHLHHDADTASGVRSTLEDFIAKLDSHGHLGRDAEGRPRYAFIHGNWALANGRSDRRWCGVDEEVPLLFDTGCYADFTFPSAPDESQPAIVNQIYWPVGDLTRARCYEQGERARVGLRRSDRLLIMQGPLAPWKRPGKLSVWIETGDLTGVAPPSAARLRAWTAQNIHVEGRPEWVFVKVHTHGAQERNAAALLGDPGRALHRELTTRYCDRERWVLHYVTAREMFNIASAAMDGKSGDPGAYRDYLIAPPPAARA